MGVGVDAARPTRVLETVLYADDVAAAAAFYVDVVGLRLLEQDELAAVFRLDDGGILLVFDPARASAPGRRVPSHGTSGAGHVAFSVASVDAAGDELRRRGAEIEREIEWGRGGRSARTAAAIAGRISSTSAVRRSSP